MYKLLLTIRYLRRKLIPWFALAAVTLCVAMLIIVLSIMGGFHDLLMGSGMKLMGDVRIWSGAQGISDYQLVLEAVRKLPQTKAATATIETWGLLKNPSGASVVVEVVGIDPQQMTGVTNYAGTVYWTPQKLAQLPTKLAAYEKEMTQLDQQVMALLAEAQQAERRDDLDKQKQISSQLVPMRERLTYLTYAVLGADEIRRYYEDASRLGRALELTDPGERSAAPSPMVVGIEVNANNARADDGSYDFLSPWIGQKLSLTLVPLTEEGDFTDRSVQRFEVVNEFHSGLFDVDHERIFIPFITAQRMLLMNEAELVDPGDPFKVIGTRPARASAIIVRAIDSVSSAQLQAEVRRCYNQLADENQNLPRYIQIDTWEDLLGDLLNTVKNEKALMTVLFGIVSFVAVILVLVIFYMIVLEKTRDIGILRALGASRAGVASIFLLYAAVIGAIGAASGTTLGYLIVTYINEIHAWLGRNFGIVIWDRKVYFFEYIPNRIDWLEVSIIVVCAIAASVVGALIPALIAARVDPVKSLRYE